MGINQKTLLDLDMRDEHKELVLKILNDHIPYLEVWAFGSRINSTARDTSDLDLVIRNPKCLEEAIAWKIIGKLQDAYEESDLPFLVDIVDWASLSDKFKSVIERGYVAMKEPVA